MISEEELSKLADEAWENSDHDCDYFTFVHTYEQGFTKALEKVKDLAVERGYSKDWYQQSIDETQEPIWTDAHLDELYGDFYLIPRNEND